MRTLLLVAGLLAFGADTGCSASAPTPAHRESGTAPGAEAATAPANAALATEAPSVSPAPGAAPVRAAEQTGATILSQAQARILAAHRKAYETRDFSGFAPIERDLAGLSGESVQLAHYRDYWLGFLFYEKSLALMHATQRDDAKIALDRAVATLKGIKTVDTEVNALLGLTTGLNLQFVPRQAIMIAIGDTNSYLSSALTEAPSLRSYYANAVADWNTPVQFGGRKKAEAMARKALAAPDRGTGALAPSWGRDMATALLIRILREGKKDAEAATLLADARKAFPESAAIREFTP